MIDMSPQELVYEIRALRHDMNRIRSDLGELMAEVREAQYVRQRLMHEMPGYWEDSVRLGSVRSKLRDAAK